MRDIAREVGCSRTAVATAVLRLARQAMAAHIMLMVELEPSQRVCFDGLVSAVATRDYASQITTLGDSERELILAMTHCITERGGQRSHRQRRRRARRAAVWHPQRGALKDSITLLVKELSQFAAPTQLRLDTDEHPIYAQVIAADLALRWYRRHQLLSVHTTPGAAARTVSNPLFLMNYVDRMIRHRLKEHTRESIALAHNATMQMHRMWLFAWDHNTRQPLRVAGSERRSRAELSQIAPALLRRLHREFFHRRFSLRRLPVPESIWRVWAGALATPPVRWRVGQQGAGLRIPVFALRDLSYRDQHGQ
jgi:hypothetical protein